MNMMHACTKSLVATIVASFVACLLVSSPVTAEEFPATLTVGDTELILNGRGKRKKAIISLYDAGLYLGQKSSDAATIVATDAPMLMRLTILSRFISSEKMQDAMNDGFAKSTGGDTSAISDRIIQFQSGFADEISKQDVFDLFYQPDTGTEVKKNGVTTVTVDGLDFKQALFGIWLSDDPVQGSLKADLLGG